MSSHEARLSLFHGDRLDYRFGNPGWRAARRPVPLADLVAQAEALDAGRCRRVVLADAPLAHPQVRDLLDRCRALGLKGLSVETDARPLAQPGMVEDLAARGVEQLFVVAGGARKRVHEAVLQDPGGFVDAMEGLRRAATSGMRLYVVVPVLRWTTEDLEPLLDWLLALKPAGGTVHGYLLALPEVDKVPAALHRVLLPYGEQAKLAARVFDAARRARVEYGFATKRGILPCAAGGALDPFGTVFFDRLNFLKHAPTPDEKFDRVPACATCSLEQSCPGVESAYAQAFGTEGLAPVALDVSMDWKLKRINRLEQRDFKNVSAFDNDGEHNGRSLIRINGHCNMSCAFCFVDRTVPDYPSDGILAAIDALAARNTDHLVLSGGEPTLHPGLPDFIRRGRTLGFRTIEAQTNGVRAADPAYARALADAGLSKVTVSLHSIDPEHSDKITRLPGAFGKTIQAMQHFRALGVLTQVAHVITKSNYAELPGTVRFLRETFPEREGHLSICFGIAQPISDLVYTWVMPTFTEIKPFMLEALDYCLDTDVGFGGMIGQGGYPPCMLDGDMRYYDRNLGNIYRSPDHDEQFYKSPRCQDCSFDPWCVGVRRAYVDTYGDAEMVPFRARIDAPLPRPAPMDAVADPGPGTDTARLVTLRRRQATV